MAWEYKVARLDIHNPFELKGLEETQLIEGFMNELGKQNWEIIKFDTALFTIKYFIVICKRQI